MRVGDETKNCYQQQQQNMIPHQQQLRHADEKFASSSSSRSGSVDAVFGVAASSVGE
jgi:hypothetical protein